MSRDVVGGPGDIDLGPPALETPAEGAARLLTMLEHELGGSVRACGDHGAAWSPAQSAAICESIAARLRQAAGDLADLAGRARDARSCR